MKKSPMKKAEKVVRKAILRSQAATSASVGELRATTFAERAAENARAAVIEGRDAYQNLCRLKGNKLDRPDVAIIARHLHQELSSLKKHLKLQQKNLGQWCTENGLGDAGESSRELHRLILPPDRDAAKVRLRRSASKYRALIEGIGRTTHQSVTALSDRVLRGTSLHPGAIYGDLNETEKVHLALSRIVEKIDNEFDLFGKYMEVANLKSAHARNGGQERWPLWSEDDHSEAAYAGADDPRNAFWRKDTIGRWGEKSDEIAVWDVGCISPPEFFYIPHARVGVGIWNDSPSLDLPPNEYSEKLDAELAYWHEPVEAAGNNSLIALTEKYAVGWNNEKNCPEERNNPYPGWGDVDIAWLVIYLSPDSSRLVPMLYQVNWVVGPILTPLDLRGLESMKTEIWLNESRHCSVFDRIKELIGYRDGDEEFIENEFRRTTPRFDHNPFFKMREEDRKVHDHDMAMLDAYLKKQLVD